MVGQAHRQFRVGQGSQPKTAGDHQIHARQPGESGAAKEISEDGLRLIVRMMREEKKRRVVLFCRSLKERFARFAAGEFD